MRERALACTHLGNSALGPTVVLLRVGGRREIPGRQWLVSPKLLDILANPRGRDSPIELNEKLVLGLAGGGKLVGTLVTMEPTVARHIMDGNSDAGS